MSQQAVIHPNELEKLALELCWEIEKLPASEQQTAISVKAATLHQELGKWRDAVIAAVPRIQAMREGALGRPESFGEWRDRMRRDARKND